MFEGFLIIESIPAQEMNTAMRVPYLQAGLILYACATLGSQAMMSIGAGAAMVLFLYGTGGPRGLKTLVSEILKKSQARRYAKVVTFFMGACLLSVAAALVFPLEIGGVKPKFTVHQVFGKVWYFYWPLVLATVWGALPKERSQRTLKVYLVAATGVAILGIVQFFTGFPREQPLNAERTYFHTNGFFGHHLAYATVMCFPFFLLLDQALNSARRVLPRSWAWFASLTSGVAIFLTWSRIVWVALPAGAALILLMNLKKQTRVWVTVALVAVGGLVAQHPMVKQRLFSAQGHQDRYEVWEANFELFKRRPITGIGWHNNPAMTQGYYWEAYPEQPQKFVSHAHNNFLHFLAGTGLLGAAGLLLWIWVGFRLSYRSSPEIFVGLLILQLNGLTQLNLLESKSLHTIMFMLGIAVWRSTQETQEESSQVA